MKAFFLESEVAIIAVINLTDKDDFYRNVRLAIAEHYLCEYDEIRILMSDEQYSKEICSQTLEIESVELGYGWIKYFTLNDVDDE